MPVIDLSVLCIPAECDNIKLPIECEIAFRWDAYLLCDICRHFASVMLHFASLISHNLRCIPAYTHQIPTGFFFNSTEEGMSLVEGRLWSKTIDATTTDRLRRSPLYLDLSPSCARKRACMELTIICRFQRLLNPSFRLFQCFRQRHVFECVGIGYLKHAKGMSLRYGVIVLGNLTILANRCTQ